MSGDVLSKLASSRGDKKPSSSSSTASTDDVVYNLACERPPEPTSIDEMKIPEQFIEDMILKLLAMKGARTEHQITWELKIPKSIVTNFMKDLVKRKLVGPPPSNPNAFICGSEGKERAEDASRSTRYLGPVPVDIEEYISMIRRQVGRPHTFNQDDIEDAFSKIVMYDKVMKDRIGPAVRSQRSILLYGAPGNGKTIIGKCLTSLLKSDLMIPYSIFAHGQIIKLYDPSVHKLVVEDEYQEYDIEKGEEHQFDMRWAIIKVPYVEVATEFTLEGFELSYNAYAKYYDMATHVKANGGVFFIDDFGRQRGKAEDYLNRLITPLQSREDILSLSSTGGQIRVPFFCIPLFSSNLTLDRIGDEAFLRRFKYKILAISPDDQALREIFQFECSRVGVPYNEDSYVHFLSKLREKGKFNRSCLANDICSKILDYCKFWDKEPTLSKEMIDLAFELNYSEQTEDWDFGTKEK